MKCGVGRKGCGLQTALYISVTYHTYAPLQETISIHMPYLYIVPLNKLAGCCIFVIKGTSQRYPVVFKWCHLIFCKAGSQYPLQLSPAWISICRNGIADFTDVVILDHQVFLFTQIRFQ